MSGSRQTRLTRRASVRAAAVCTLAACAAAAGALIAPAAIMFPHGASAGPASADPASASASSPTTSSATTTPPTPASADDIRDIRGPKSVFPSWLVPALLALFVLLALGGYALGRWQRRRRRPRALLPFEIALQRLEALRPLMQPATVREFSIAISDIVRGHIEQAFAVTATHRTTEEFLRDLLDSSNASLAAHRNLLEEFLHRCDVAKFAGVSLSRQIMESLYQSARSFVIETSKPQAAPAPHPAHDSLPAT